MSRTAKLVLIISFALLTTFSLGLARSSRGSLTAWLGVYTQTVDSELAGAFDLSVKAGAIVNDVVDDSPADEAGIKEDDIIISFNGSQIMGAEDLTELVQESQAGDDVVLKIVRDGREEDVTVTIGERKAPQIRFFDKYRPGKHSYSWYSGSKSYIGVQLTELTDQLRVYFGVRDDEGVLIAEVEEDSPAEEAGLQAGDVIVTVDDEEITHVGDVQEVIHEKDEGETVNVGVVRDKRKTEVSVTVGSREDVSVPWSINEPDLPHLDFFFPRMKGLYRSGGPDLDLLFEADEVEDEMDELREELQELKRELRELRDSRP